MISKTPEPPYFAVIFTSVKNKNIEAEKYKNMAKRMRILAESQEGFLGFENAENEKNEISVSYWKDLNSIKKWKENVEHIQAQFLGRNNWYKTYKVRIARVEKDYGFNL